MNDLELERHRGKMQALADKADYGRLPMLKLAKRIIATTDSESEKAYWEGYLEVHSRRRRRYDE